METNGSLFNSDTYLSRYKVGVEREKGEARRYREGLLNQFLGKGIKIKVKGELVDADAGKIAILVSYLKDDGDLKALLDVCKRAESFSKMFWFFVNPKKKA